MKIYLKSILKIFIVSLYPLALFAEKIGFTGSRPFMCFVTPVFDGSLEPMKKLIEDTQKQSSRSFIHVFISNGQSPKTQSYLKKISLADNRYIYIELPEAPTSNGVELLSNLGLRRNYGLMHFQASRYVFADADSVLMDRHYIAKLMLFHFFTKKDVILTRTHVDDRILPIVPVYIGNIDITCMNLSNVLARKGLYPTDVDPTFESANDCRFFYRINSPTNTAFSPIDGFIKNSRKGYETVGSYFDRTYRLSCEMVTDAGSAANKMGV